MIRQNRCGSTDYQTPEVKGVRIDFENILCSSPASGENDNLVKEDMGDIWY